MFVCITIVVCEFICVSLHLHLCDLAIPPRAVREAGWLVGAPCAFSSPVWICVFEYLRICICICVIWQSYTVKRSWLAGWCTLCNFLSSLQLCICVFGYLCLYLHLYFCDLAISHSEEKLAGAPCATSSPVCNQVTLTPYIQPPPPLSRQTSLCAVFVFVCCVCICLLCLYLYLCLCNQVSFTTSIWLFMILMLSKTILVLIFTQSFDSYPRLTLIHI